MTARRAVRPAPAPDLTREQWELLWRLDDAAEDGIKLVVGSGKQDPAIRVAWSLKSMSLACVYSRRGYERVMISLKGRRLVNRTLLRPMTPRQRALLARLAQADARSETVPAAAYGHDGDVLVMYGLAVIERRHAPAHSRMFDAVNALVITDQGRTEAASPQKMPGRP